MTFRLLLLWTLAAFVFCQAGSTDIIVEEYTNKIKLSCKDGDMRKGKDSSLNTSIVLSYKDDNTGEYQCVNRDSNDVLSQIYVKFRTCDNCVEFDVTSIASILAGNLVATAGIGVAVYLVASQTQTSRGASNQKKSEKQHSARKNNQESPYQHLKHGTKDEYDLLQTKR